LQTASSKLPCLNYHVRPASAGWLPGSVMLADMPTARQPLTTRRAPFGWMPTH